MHSICYGFEGDKMKVKYAIKEGEKIEAVNRDEDFLYLKYPAEWVKIPITDVKQISVIDDSGKTLRTVSVDDFYKTHLKNT